jgi:hypothetical protein
VPWEQPQHVMTVAKAITGGYGGTGATITAEKIGSSLTIILHIRPFKNFVGVYERHVNDSDRVRILTNGGRLSEPYQHRA